MKQGIRIAIGVVLFLAQTTIAANSQDFVGGVYAMSNKFDGNTIVAYGRDSDGRLSLIGEFPTGGNGAAFDGGEGLDPLISAYSVILTDNRRHLIAVNAGSNTVSVFRVQTDFSLTLTDQQEVAGVGPNSIAYFDSRVYVSSIDADGVFTGEPDQEGVISGYSLTPGGQLLELSNSARDLGNRPSAIQFSPDGKFLVVSSINAGSAALESGNTNEITVFASNLDGSLSAAPVSAASSTLPNNEEGRNLPSGIGFEIVKDEGQRYVVVTEAREFRPDGSPPAFFELQAGSISTWRLEDDGALTPISLDVITGNSPTDGERTACWIAFSRDESVFWVSNALESTLSSYAFDEGQVELIERVAAAGNPPDNTTPQDAFATTDGWIDLWTSDDGKYVYQLFGLSGTIAVFKVDNDGQGPGLTEIQRVSDLPETNTQGLVAF